MSGELQNVEMPDGTIIEDVPVDMSQAELLEKYKKHVAQDFDTNLAGIKKQIENYLGDEKRDLTMAPARFILAAVKPIAGTAELLGTDKLSKIVEMLDEIAKKRSGAAGSIASVIGDITGAVGGIGAVSKGITLLPKAAKIAEAAKNLSPIAKTAIEAGALGVTNPTGKTYGSNDFLYDKAKEAVISAGLGVAGHKAIKAGASILDPKLKRLAELKAQGFDIDKFIKDSTLGQVLGGSLQKFEHILESVPASGVRSKVNAGRVAFEKQLSKLQRQLNKETARKNLDTRAKYKQDIAALGKNKVASKVEDDADKFEKELAELEQKLNEETDPEAAEKLFSEFQQKLNEGHERDLSVLGSDESTLGSGGDTGARVSLDNVFKQAKLDRAALHKKEMEALEKEHGNFSIPIVQKVLDHIGETLPAHIKTGHEAIEHAIKTISGDRLTGQKGAYDKLLESMGDVPANSQTLANLRKIVDDANSSFSGLDKKTHSELSKIVNEQLIAPLEETGAISPDKWHTIYKQLGNLAFSKSKGDSYQQSLGQALNKIKSEWANLAESVDSSGTLKKINDAFSSLQPVQRAAAGTEASARYGNFTPKELIASANAEASTRAAGSGTAPFEKEGIDAFNAMKARKEAMEARHAQEIADLETQHGQAKIDLENQLQKSNLETEAQKTVLKSNLDDQLLENRSDLAERKAALNESNKDIPGEPPSWLANTLGKSATLGAVSQYLRPVTEGILSTTNNPIVAGLQSATSQGIIPALSVLAPTLSTKLLYGNDVAQNILKSAATKERPQWVQDIGTAARGYIDNGGSAPAAIGTVAAKPQQINSGQNVQVYSVPDNYGQDQSNSPAPVSQKAGGLVGLKRR